MLFGIYFVFLIISRTLVDALHNTVSLMKRRLNVVTAVRKHRHARYWMMANIGTVVAVVLASGAVLANLQDWTFIQGVYFALQTATVSVYLFVWHAIVRRLQSRRASHSTASTCACLSL
jgi:hypothetical protein